MKQSILTYSFLLLLLPVFAAETATEKKITKEWATTASTVLTFNAKYQDIEFAFWNENKVKLEMNITTNAEVDIEDLEEMISLTADNTGNALNINLKLKPGKSNSVWDWLFGSKKVDVSIKNVLYMPNNLASLVVISSYADIKSASIPMPFTLRSNYGDINIEELKKPSIINANYSEIKINKAESLDITSNYGDLSVMDADNIKITSTYADVKIDQLNNTFTSTNTYGDIKIKAIDKAFTKIKCTSVYSDHVFGLNDNNPIQLDVHARNADITKENLQIQKIEEVEENGVTIYKAKTKSATAASPVIIINTTYGDVAFKKY